MCFEMFFGPVSVQIVKTNPCVRYGFRCRFANNPCLVKVSVQKHVFVLVLFWEGAQEIFFVSWPLEILGVFWKTTPLKPLTRRAAFL